MQLTPHDAYAFRRILSKMDVPEELELSPVTQLLLDAIDPVNTPEGWNILQDMVTSNQGIMEQVLFVDPKATPPHGQDDHDYVTAYVQQAVSQTNVAAPDTTRTNGSTEMLVKLHEVNQQGGPESAKKLLDQYKSQVESMNALFDAEYIEYYDSERIVQAREITAVVGQPGAGKSFWTLSKLAEIADTTPVLYITAEGINVDRVRALVKMREEAGIEHTDEYSESFKFFRKSVDFTTDAGVELFIQQMGYFYPEVIAIDTFAACTPGIDENSSKDVQPVLNRLRKYFIEERGCAILLIHHTTKDGKSFRGSSALRANVANMFYLTKDDDIITLRSDKQRDSEPNPDCHYRLVKYNTRVNQKTGEQITSAAMVKADKVVEDTSEPKKLPRNQRTILETLNNFKNGLTTRALQNATDISKTTLWRNLQTLSKQGYITTGEKGEPVYITQQGRDLLA